MGGLTACLLAVARMWAGAVLPAEADGVLLREGYEESLDLKVPIHGANQPYQAHAIGLTTEKAHEGTHSVKIDVDYKHGFDVYLAPRSNETPQVEWGSLGSAGTFVLPGLGIPLRTDRGYVLSLWLWVEKASAHNPVMAAVETAADSPYGVARTQTQLTPAFSAPTQGWVHVEKELTSFLVEQMDAGGANTEGLRLDSISLNSFANGQYRMTAYVDDITVREIPLSAVADLRRRDQGGPARKVFRSYPEVEDLFVWGVYGALTEPSPDWYRPYKPGPQAGVRAEQAERVKQLSDWMLLDLRRHYGNVVIQGGGMLFPTEGQSAFDYVKAALDKCGEYGVKFSPSSYLTQHYIPDATREQCDAAMRKAAGLFGPHPAMLAYWLVDEPGSSTAGDYYWGKERLESLDARHPSLCTCNCIASIAEFAPTLPIVCIDYYPIGPTPKDDRGAWAVGDSVRYARTLGAKRVWVLPQVFGQSSWRAPSREEFAIQIWSSLAEGATGFAPYSHAQRPTWHNLANEYGNLVDPYGNASPNWEEMKRLGPYLRSAGTLLAGAKRLPDEAAAAQVAATVVSNVGRKRPAAVARLFADEKRKVRYAVVHNNTTAYRYAFPVAVQQMAPEERVLDLFALRDVPRDGNTFGVFLPPGDGRLYALGTPEALAAVRDEVLQRRYDIERDLLELEVRVARRMGTQVAPVQAALKDAGALFRAGKRHEALQKVKRASLLLERQSRANAAYRPVHQAVEETRLSLGRTNALMNRRIIGLKDFAKDDPEVKALGEKMISLSDRFYTLQAQLLRQGPKGLAAPAAALLHEVQAFEAAAEGFLGV